ncbi:MAG: hypothetical protein WBM40_00500 [Thiohalocapsa sp.]
MTTLTSNTASLQPSSSTGRTLLRIWLVVSQLVTLAALGPWIGAAAMSFMAFDTGIHGSAVIFVVVMWTYPVLALVCVIAAWVAFKKQWNRLAAVLSGLPLIPPLILWLLIQGSIAG